MRLLRNGRRSSARALRCSRLASGAGTWRRFGSDRIGSDSSESDRIGSIAISAIDPIALCGLFSARRIGRAHLTPKVAPALSATTLTSGPLEEVSARSN